MQRQKARPAQRQQEEPTQVTHNIMQQKVDSRIRRRQNAHAKRSVREGYIGEKLVGIRFGKVGRRLSPYGDREGSIHAHRNKMEGAAHGRHGLGGITQTSLRDALYAAPNAKRPTKPNEQQTKTAGIKQLSHNQEAPCLIWQRRTPRITAANPAKWHNKMSPVQTAEQRRHAKTQTTQKTNGKARGCWSCHAGAGRHRRRRFQQTSWLKVQTANRRAMFCSTYR